MYIVQNGTIGMVESNVTYTPIRPKCFIVLLLSSLSPLFVHYLHETKCEVFWNPRGIDISLMQARDFQAWIVVVNVFSLMSMSQLYVCLLVAHEWSLSKHEWQLGTIWRWIMKFSFLFWSIEVSTLRFSVEYLAGHKMSNVLACISVTLSIHFNNQELYMVLLHD